MKRQRATQRRSKVSGALLGLVTCGMGWAWAQLPPSVPPGVPPEPAPPYEPPAPPYVPPEPSPGPVPLPPEQWPPGTGVPGPIPTYTPTWHELWSSNYGKIGQWEGYYGWTGSPVCTRYYVIGGPNSPWWNDIPEFVKETGTRIYEWPPSDFYKPGAFDTPAEVF